jgi:hypothetical protein
MTSGIESKKIKSDYFINLDLLLIKGYFNINIKSIVNWLFNKNSKEIEHENINLFLWQM